MNNDESLEGKCDVCSAPPHCSDDGDEADHACGCPKCNALDEAGEERPVRSESDRIKAIERLQGDLAKTRDDLETARGLLREQEWSMYDRSVGDYACRWCLALRAYDKGKHKPDCRLSAFLYPPVVV